MHRYLHLDVVSVNEFISGFHFVPVLLTDGPERAEENVTYKQFDLHNVWSSL